MNFLTCLKDYREIMKSTATAFIPPNVWRLGATRSGKTWAAAKDVFGMVGRCAIVVLDFHGTLIDVLLPHLVMAGFGDRVIFDKISNLDRVLGFEFLHRPKSKDWLERRREEDLVIGEFVDTVLFRRGMQNSWEHPWIDFFTRLALRAHLKQKVRLPDFLPPYALKVGSDQFTNYRTHCIDSDVRYELGKLASNRRLQEQSLPAERILSGLCSSATWMSRCKPTFDLEEKLKQKWIILLSGRGEISETAKRDYLGSVDRCVSQTVRRYFNRTGEALPVRIEIDEAVDGRMISSHLIRDLIATQKMGLSYGISSQIEVDDDETMDGIKQGCNRLEVFRLGSDRLAEISARDYGVPLLDSHAVHHTDIRNRQVADGFDEIPFRTTTEGTQVSDHGESVTNSSTNSVTRGFRDRPRYREEQDQIDHFWAFNDQLMMVRRSIRTLPVGYRWVYENGRVWREYVKPLKTYPFPEVVKARTQAFLEEMRQRPCFVTPQVFLPKLASQKGTKRSAKGSTTRKRWQ